MKKLAGLFLVIFIFQLSTFSQTLEEKLKEIDDYANAVMTTHKANSAGMAIAIVKDDKVVFAKGYGVKSITSSPTVANRLPNNSPTEAYGQLYQAVKSKNTSAIKGATSRVTWSFADMIAERQKATAEKVFENGFTATTFGPSLPVIRDERIKENFGAVEVYNAKESRWEDLPFVYEDGGWRLAIGELFAGTYQSPGKGRTTRESEAAGGIITSHSAPVVGKGVGNATASGERRSLSWVTNASPSNAVDENTLFAIASNSKAFTTASLAILVDEKKLAWEDKVSKYLPDFQMYDPWVTSELTVRDLVTHRVGLDTFSGDLLWYETTYTSDEILARVRYLKPFSSFRTRYGYQNLMFIAAGKIVEKVSGKPWCSFVRERILDPLGMTSTTCGFGTLGANAAIPHNESGGTFRPLPHGNVNGGYGAVALNSSVNDLSKWIRLQLGKGTVDGKKIFSEQQSWQLHQPYLFQPISEAASRNNPTRHFSGVGMGWFVYDYYGRKIINHSGGLDGMLSYTVLIPEEKVGFVILTNSESRGFAIMMNKIRDMFVNAPKRDWNTEAAEQIKTDKADAEKERQKVDAARVANTKPSLAIGAYAGTYSDKLYGDVVISEEGGRLVMRFTPAPNFVADLEHWHYDTFQIRWRPSAAYNFPRGFVTFTIDKTGKTDELKIDQPNNDFWFYELTPRRVK